MEKYGLGFVEFYYSTAGGTFQWFSNGSTFRPGYTPSNSSNAIFPLCKDDSATPNYFTFLVLQSHSSANNGNVGCNYSTSSLMTFTGAQLNTIPTFMDIPDFPTFNDSDSGIWFIPLTVIDDPSSVGLINQPSGGKLLKFDVANSSIVSSIPYANRSAAGNNSKLYYPYTISDDSGSDDPGSSDFSSISTAIYTLGAVMIVLAMFSVIYRMFINRRVRG